MEATIQGLRLLKVRGSNLGVSIIRIIIYWGLSWGLILGNYHVGKLRTQVVSKELCFGNPCSQLIRPPRFKATSVGQTRGSRVP